MSSLSSQSPPASPSLPPPPPADPTDLSLSQRGDAPKVDNTPPESAESLSQSENESESAGQSLSGAWEPKAWPEGRQVLTHLVDGFVIQEGLQPFPVGTPSDVSVPSAPRASFHLPFFLSRR